MRTWNPGPGRADADDCDEDGQRGGDPHEPPAPRLWRERCRQGREQPDGGEGDETPLNLALERLPPGLHQA